MPGPLLHVGALVTCAHMGFAEPMIPNPKVLVLGQPTVTRTSPYRITGCTMPPPTAGNGPCVTAMWTTSALKVLSLGQPLLLMDSQATCVPTGTPLIVSVTQPKVIGM